jgi:PucR family transcriptional regulator, purine catabolism regulatory protein
MRRPIWFDEVQLYLLLEQFSRSEDVQEWLRSTIGPLAEYDRRNRTQMMHTVEVYFDASQSLHQAALELHIHPNSLKYRLQRIKQLLGQDPFKGENQLQFYLATKVARLLE